MDFEELGKKLKKFSQDTVTEVQKMNEVRQLNGKISDEKKLLNRLYLEMGQKLYDTYKDAELPLEEFDGDFRKIRERYVAIDLLQEKIRNVKGVVLCPCCNMEVAAGERYCTNCGNKMPETVKLEETTDEDAVEVESTVVEPEVESEEGESEKAEDAVEQAESAAEDDLGEAQAETVSEKADETETTEAGFGETKEESQAEEAVCEAAEETGACARSAHQEETVAADELAADAEAAVEEAEEETAKEAAESTSEE